MGKRIRYTTNIYRQGHGNRGNFSTIAINNPVGNNLFTFRANSQSSGDGDRVLPWRQGSDTPPVNLILLNTCKSGLQMPPEDLTDLNDAFLYPAENAADVTDRAFVSWTIATWTTWYQAFNAKFYGMLVEGKSVYDARNAAVLDAASEAISNGQQLELAIIQTETGSYWAACPIWGDDKMKFNSLYNGSDSVEQEWFKVD